MAELRAEVLIQAPTHHRAREILAQVVEVDRVERQRGEKVDAWAVPGLEERCRCYSRGDNKSCPEHGEAA